MATLKRTIPYTQVEYTYEEDAGDKALKKSARQDAIEAQLKGTSKVFTITDQACIALVKVQHALWVAMGCQSNPQTWGCGPEPLESKCYKAVNFQFSHLSDFSDCGSATLPRGGTEPPVYGSATDTVDPPECQPCPTSFLQPDASISVALHNPVDLSPDQNNPNAADQQITFKRTYIHKDYGTRDHYPEYNNYVFDATKKRKQYDGVDGYSTSCQCIDCDCGCLTANDGIVPNMPLSASSDLLCDQLGPGWFLKTVHHNQYDTCNRGQRSFYLSGDCYYCAYDATGPAVVTNPNQPGGPNDPF